MKLTRNADLYTGAPPALHYQMNGFKMAPLTYASLNLSFYLPGGHVATVECADELIYFILEGNMEVTTGDGVVTMLGKYDSMAFGPGSIRTVKNPNNYPCVMVVVGSPKGNPFGLWKLEEKLALEKKYNVGHINDYTPEILPEPFVNATGFDIQNHCYFKARLIFMLPGGYMKPTVYEKNASYMVVDGNVTVKAGTEADFTAGAGRTVQVHKYDTFGVDAGETVALENNASVANWPLILLEVTGPNV